jgi:hypothetical protein
MPDLVRVVFERILLEYADDINQIVLLVSLECRVREIMHCCYSHVGHSSEKVFGHHVTSDQPVDQLDP